MVDANLITSFKPNAAWTAHQRRKTLYKIGNFSFDGSSDQTGNAAFTPATPMSYTALESQHRLTKLTHHAKHES